MKFRIKPEVALKEIDAEQWHEGQVVKGVLMESTYALKVDDPAIQEHYPPTVRHYVVTAQGQNVYIENGEWIVDEGDGVHHYPIKDEIFRAKYEPVE